jgi:hypothetical protein
MSEYCNSIDSIDSIDSMYSIDIDTNNGYLITRLIYYLWEHHRAELEKQCTEYIVDDRIIVKNKPTVLYMPCQPLVVEYAQYPIYIEYSRTRAPNNAHISIVRFEKYKIVSKNSLDHLLSFVNKLNEIDIPEAGYDISKFIWDHDDQRWSHLHLIKPRKIETIYLPEKQQIVDRLDTFLNDTHKHALYASLDIPDKQIFLLYGIPGSGKTSLIRALASHFKHNLAVVKNVDKIDDQALERMMIRLPERTFLVFEDIDCMFHQRELRSRSGITYSGLLNLLDGLNHYNKLVVFITTNIIQELDTAFRRRMDMFIEFGYIRKEQVIRMYEKFFSEDSVKAESFYTKIKGKKLTVNMLEKYFIYCLHKNQNPSDCIVVLEEYSDKTAEKSVNLYM